MDLRLHSRREIDQLQKAGEGNGLRIDRELLIDEINFGPFGRCYGATPDSQNQNPERNPALHRFKPRLKRHPKLYLGSNSLVEIAKRMKNRRLLGSAA